MNKITPYGLNILIKPVVQQTVIKKQEGALCDYGEVLAVGSLVESIKVGDVIAFSPWGCKHVEINNEKHYFVRLDDRFVLGTVGVS